MQLAELCDKYGLPHDVEVLHRHLVGNAQLVYAAKDHLIGSLEQRIALLRSALERLLAAQAIHTSSAEWPAAADEARQTLEITQTGR